jgi:hypothetical protein
VDRTDQDNDGACQWDLDGTPVSSSCVWYEYTEDGDGDHTLTYTIDDGVNPIDSVSWTVGPKATFTSVTPEVANLDTAEAQVYTAVIDDPWSSGAQCEILLDGVLVQAIGSCSYNHVNDNDFHEITFDIVYDGAGTVRNSEPVTVWAAPKANADVEITSVHDDADVFHYELTQTTEFFTVTGTNDPDGDAEINWYINETLVDCVSNPDCEYDNDTAKTGLRLTSYDGSWFRVKAVLTDGQYSDEHTFNVKLGTPEVNESAPMGFTCNESGQTFEVFGRGFEQDDEWKIMNQDVVMDVVNVAYDRVILRLPADVIPGSQMVQNTKGSTIVQSSFDFITFTNGVCP